MKTPNPENDREPGRPGRVASWLAAAALATAVLALGPVPAFAQAGLPEICPPSDAAACLVRCKLHKRKCHRACNARKKQCLHKVRAEVQTCKLGCRADSSVDESVSVCRRRCVAAGIEAAREQCKAGKPVCMRACNPESCREMCDINGGPGDDGATDVEPVGEVQPQGALELEPADERPTDGDICVPPVDRECLGACATELRDCARRVHAAGRECITGCKELRGEERWVCFRECATTAHEQGQRCKEGFRRCSVECHDVATEEGGGIDDRP